MSRVIIICLLFCFEQTISLRVNQRHTSVDIFRRNTSVVSRSGNSFKNQKGCMSSVPSEPLPIPDSKTIISGMENKSKEVSGSKRLKVFIYFALWYFLSIFYNIHNKRALNLLKLPWLVATAQMGLGLPLFIPLWAFRIREFPANDLSDFKDILKHLRSVAFYQTLTHISGVIALGAGAVSFTQVVKASEPAFTAFISAIFEKEFFTIPVYLTLIPVIIGVGLASVTELTFSWYCLFAGILANIFAAARGVFVSFKALNNVHPVTHALANTLKRIVIILTSVLVFHNQLTPLGIIGTILAISGVCLYSLAQYSSKTKTKKE
eukprot:gene7800-15959_t